MGKHTSSSAKSKTGSAALQYSEDELLVEVPEPWALSSYFSGERILDAKTKKVVEQYLEAAPQVKKAYIDMKNRDMQRAENIRKVLSSMTL